MFKPLLSKLGRLFHPTPKRILFKPEWEVFLQSNLPIYASLPNDLREKLHARISEFIPRVYWEGAKGLELTEEMIATVAAQACLLTLNMDGNPYRILRTIIIFPESFIHEGTSGNKGGTLTESRRRVSGLSYGSGTVSLAWEETERGGRVKNDGYNVVFHEFAHQLDQADGYANGAPILRRPGDYKQWNAVMNKEYDRLIRDSASGKVTLLDDYGATDPAEFFAVATETFFEKPGKMHRHYPELYGIMRQYYQLDPKEWN